MHASTISSLLAQEDLPKINSQSFRRSMSMEQFAKIYWQKIHFGNRNLKAVGHSFQKIYDVPWFGPRMLLEGRETPLKIWKIWLILLPLHNPTQEVFRTSRDADSVKIFKLHGPTSLLPGVGARDAYAMHFKSEKIGGVYFYRSENWRKKLRKSQ